MVSVFMVDKWNTRNLVTVIDRIVKCAPDLLEPLSSARTSAHYTAPEAMVYVWRDVANILNGIAINHPKGQEIADIFSGREKIKAKTRTRKGCRND